MSFNLQAIVILFYLFILPRLIGLVHK